MNLRQMGLTYRLKIICSYSTNIEYYGAAHENIQFGQDMSVESLLEFVMNVFK